MATTGAIARAHGDWGRSLLELLASMRFAIALLTLICVASVIGTVLQQQLPRISYINEFGPFWADLFFLLQLNTIYSAWWFLLIMCFLVVSTSLCIARHLPKILADWRVFKEDIRIQSLGAFHHQAKAKLAGTPDVQATRLGQHLVGSGWKVRLQPRETPDGTGIMLAAKAGAANKVGYLAAHSAIVLICLGGLLDGNLMVKLQMWLGDKAVYRSGVDDGVTEQNRLPATNPSFRANLMVPEGQRSSSALIAQSNGLVVQDLPFDVELKRFIVEYYSTGMPKLFASEIILHDKDTGQATPARVEVNHPVSHRGIEIYQSSFDDGGSSVTLKARALTGQTSSLTVHGVVGRSQPITIAGQPMTLEIEALRVINVENLGNADETSASATSGADLRRVDLGQALHQRLGAANKRQGTTDLRNVGPSVVYKLRDAAGQAREFTNYMLPVSMGDSGVPVFLLGVRENQNEPFRYLRIPADQQGSMRGFEQLRLALEDPMQRAASVKDFVEQALPDGDANAKAQLRESAGRVLDVFAGSQSVAGAPAGGLQAVAALLERNVPENERERAANVLMRILNGVMHAVYENAQTPPPVPEAPDSAATERTNRFLAQAIVALSDAKLYPVPIAFELTDFNHVQASVFQVARAPGKWVVYAGCLFLILGVFAMLYVRERRLWIWFTPNGEALTQAHMAMSTNRKTLDADHEFALLRNALLSEENTQ